MKKVNLRNERIGAKGVNKSGLQMEVIEYKTFSNILVKFEKGEPIRTNWTNFSSGCVKSPYDRSIFGVGFIGEGKFKVTNNRKPTRSYKTWYDMLKRSYCEKYQEKHICYKGCTVAEEWHNYQTFAKWYEENYYEINGQRMHLDKDILIKGNKMYSPENCLIVPLRINQLFIKGDSYRGKYPIGVIFLKNIQKFQAGSWNGTGKLVNLGYYKTPEEAFKAYKIFKERLIKQVSEDYKDKIPYKLYEAMNKYIIEITD
jgi:hypothetical protein